MVLQVLNSSEVTKMLDDILPALSELKRGQEKRLKLVKAVFDALKTAQINSKHNDDVVQRIVADFSNYDRSHLMKLVDYFIERIRNNDDEFMRYFIV